ncbi:MAG: GyrI-like domain-containing protein [Salibacteraceae bacterium]
MEQLEIERGQYAHFLYKGAVSGFGAAMGRFYGAWLPQSGFALDHRPHFERLDQRYLGPTHPDSVEEVYIPVKKL